MAPITVTVHAARGLVPAKGPGNPISTSVKVALFGMAEDAVTESELQAETAEPTYSFSVSTTVEKDDASLAMLVDTPVVITIMEETSAALAKTPLGSVTLPLEQLISAAAIAEQWLPLDTAGEVLVSASTSPRQLLDEEDLEETTVLSVGLVSMDNLPTSWLLQEGQSEADHLFTYSASLTIGGKSVEITDGTYSQLPTPMEPDGETPAGPTPPPTIAFPPNGGKIFLGASALETWRAAAADASPIQLILARVLKAPDAYVDTNAAKYRAAVSVDLKPILEIDCTSYTGASTVMPAPPAEPAEPVEVVEDPKGKKAPAKGKGKEPEPLPAEEEEEVHPFVSAGTYVNLSFSLERPINPMPPPPPPPLPPTTSLIPKRILPAYEKKTAAADFQQQVSSIIDSLVKEWTDMFPDVDPATDSSPAAKDERRRTLLYALNTNGQYFVFKEKLKRAVVRLARETAKRPGGDAPDDATVQLFYNDLYVSLTQRMHAALDTIFFPPVQPPAAPSAPDKADGTPTPATLKKLADESEALFALEAAAKYHQERVATDKYEYAGWLDYGTFLMRAGQFAKAEECTREALALASADEAALLAHGCVLACRGNFEQAEVFLKARLDLDPADIQLWLLMGILYERMDRRRDVKTAIKQATAMAGSAEALAPLYMALAQRLLPLAAAPLVERALELAGSEQGLPAVLCKAELLLQAGAPELAMEALVAVKPQFPKDVGLLSKLGNALLLQKKPDQARAVYEKCVTVSPEPRPVQVLLLLGGICLEAGDPARARELYLFACRTSSSCASWLGAGSAALELGELAEAEECLCEANVLNNREPTVWGKLALLCARQQRHDEAEQAYEQAGRLDIADAPLLLAIGDAMLACGRWQLAESAFRRSILAATSPATVARLADSLLEQHKYEEALASYKEAAAAEEATAATVDHCKARARELLINQLGRPQEAALFA